MGKRYRSHSVRPPSPHTWRSQQVIKTHKTLSSRMEEAEWGEGMLPTTRLESLRGSDGN